MRCCEQERIPRSTTGGRQGKRAQGDVSPAEREATKANRMASDKHPCVAPNGRTNLLDRGTPRTAGDTNRKTESAVKRLRYERWPAEESKVHEVREVRGQGKGARKMVVRRTGMDVRWKDKVRVWVHALYVPRQANGYDDVAQKGNGHAACVGASEREPVWASVMGSQDLNSLASMGIISTGKSSSTAKGTRKVSAAKGNSGVA
ncbi:hypothetical protein B0H14DRAFT_3125671 [Mycena olivaceomarginata]|nr:hypothetical protein B0H14DRAFT_3125671 [Mycena olivaceomarginata]